MSEQPPDLVRHETTDVAAWPLWLTATGLVIGCILVFLSIAYFFDILQYRATNRDREVMQAPPSVTNSRVQFPEPRLQVVPEVDLAALRAREEAELNSYGWIDKNAGVVRIPIDRAMDLLIQQGLPVNGEPGAPAPHRTALDLQQARPLERETQSPIRTK